MPLQSSIANLPLAGRVEAARSGPSAASQRLVLALAEGVTVKENLVREPLAYGPRSVYGQSIACAVHKGLRPIDEFRPAQVLSKVAVAAP